MVTYPWRPCCYTNPLSFGSLDGILGGCTDCVTQPIKHKISRVFTSLHGLILWRQMLYIEVVSVWCRDKRKRKRSCIRSDWETYQDIMESPTHQQSWYRRDTTGSGHPPGAKRRSNLTFSLDKKQYPTVLCIQLLCKPRCLHDYKLCSLILHSHSLPYPLGRLVSSRGQTGGGVTAGSDYTGCVCL